MRAKPRSLHRTLITSWRRAKTGCVAGRPTTMVADIREGRFALPCKIENNRWALRPLSVALLVAAPLHARIAGTAICAARFDTCSPVGSCLVYERRREERKSRDRSQFGIVDDITRGNPSWGHHQNCANEPKDGIVDDIARGNPSCGHRQNCANEPKDGIVDDVVRGNPSWGHHQNCANEPKVRDRGRYCESEADSGSARKARERTRGGIIVEIGGSRGISGADRTDPTDRSNRCDRASTRSLRRRRPWANCAECDLPGGAGAIRINRRCRIPDWRVKPKQICDNR